MLLKKKLERFKAEREGRDSLLKEEKDAKLKEDRERKERRRESARLSIKRIAEEAHATRQLSS